MSDLAAQCGLTPSGLTRAADRLVEAGLVKRESCPVDRRGAFATLTGLGRDRTSEAIARHDREIEDLLGDTMSANDEARLIELLRTLRDRVHPDGTLGAGGRDSH